VSGLVSGVSALSANYDSSCVATASGAAKCWGVNGYSQLGDGTTTNRNWPVDVVGLSSGVSNVGTGAAFSCAIVNGGVKCWGSNAWGEIGDGTNTFRYTPVGVSGLTSGVAAISLGRIHTCALTSTGGVLCWGSNQYGEIGDNTITSRSTPTGVSGLGSGVVMIASGDYHNCALLSTGGVKCWGYNGYGQLGDNTTTDRHTPVSVSGLTSGVRAIAAGFYHTCAILTNGQAKCWGYNANGQLGDGTGTDRHVPTGLVGLTSTGVTCSGFVPYGDELAVVPQGGGIATLEWHKSASAQAGGYRVYWDNGTGTIDYSAPVTTITDPLAQSWNTGVLAEGTYCFALRTYTSGCCEAADEAVACGKVYNVLPCSQGDPTARIKIPAAGQRLSGNRTLIFADVFDRCGGNADVQQVLFQYRPEASGTWTDVIAANSNHPNPDIRPPYFVQWDVSGLANGNYYLRAVAYNLGGTPDPNPEDIKVVVDSVNHRSQEEACSSGCRLINNEMVYSGRDNEVCLGNDISDSLDKVIIPETALTAVTDTIIMTVENPADHADKCPPGKLCDAGEYRTIHFDSGQSCLNNGLKAQVKISYKDDDNDGIVDGTSITGTSLKVHKWISGTDWLEIPSTVDPANKQVAFETDCFSLFGLFADQPVSSGGGGGESAGGVSCGSASCGAEGSLGFGFFGILGGIFFLRRRSRKS
jgi:hypothetical protein